jgi:UDP-N-acetylmuramoyl-tripeptide--D-alanyl-D-alanine ligase
MKKLIEWKLKFLARAVLAKYKPIIIGVTGSVGKTSTKEAIFSVLCTTSKQIGRSSKNYNNEIGLPLSILRQDSPGRNPFGWIALFFRALGLIIQRDPNYPEILILEMGVDRPGDMDYLSSIVTCDIGIVTTVGTVHLEYFKNKSELQKEKGKLIRNVKKEGWSIINADEEETRKMISLSKAKVITYGFSNDAMARASDLRLSYKTERGAALPKGLSFKLTYKGSSIPIHIPNALGEGVAYSALAAASVGLASGMNLHEVSQALLAYRSPKARLNVIAGIKDSVIIDDTYNAEPKSMALAIQVLGDTAIKKGQKKIAALGDMLELGSLSEKSHQEIGRLAHGLGIDRLVTVGERARDIARGAREAGMPETSIASFADSVSAGRFIQDIMKKGDVVLAKGSQGMRMERTVLEIMAEPLRAKELLIRQDWEA